MIAGGGPLPRHVVEACRTAGRDVFVVALHGITEPATADGAAHAWVRLGAVGQMLKVLREAGVADVVMAGPVPRPSLGSLGLDLRGFKLLAGAGAGALGDDRLLSLIVAELEGEGFRVVGVDDILAGLVMAAGSLGKFEPDASALADIAVGARAACRLGELDIGQAVVVQQGVVLGLEAIEGTDALLVRCGGLRRAGPGGVLVKLSKPRQERRADLPAIGVATVAGATAAGLRGIAVEAGRSLVIDRGAVARAADEAGLFVVGIQPDPGR